LARIHVPQSEDVEKFMREESHTPEISPPWRVVLEVPRVDVDPSCGCPPLAIGIDA
jgi:hypothetical protein